MKKGLELESIAGFLNVKKPIIISGPCSAETEEQMVATAKQIAATGSFISIAQAEANLS